MGSGRNRRVLERISHNQEVVSSNPYECSTFISFSFSPQSSILHTDSSRRCNTTDFPLKKYFLSIRQLPWTRIFEYEASEWPAYELALDNLRGCLVDIVLIHAIALCVHGTTRHNLPVRRGQNLKPSTCLLLNLLTSPDTQTLTSGTLSS